MRAPTGGPAMLARRRAPVGANQPAGLLGRAPAGQPCKLRRRPPPWLRGGRGWGENGARGT
eukprot:12379925-Alexandrium_andersonii.AAC.1